MARLLRISIGGHMAGGDVWSVNPVFSVGGDFGAPVSPSQAQTIATAIVAAAVPTTLTQMWAPGTTMDTYRVEARSITGVLETQAEAVELTPINGTGTVAHPQQTAMVSSLRSTHPGATGRGRLYWPATGVPISTVDYRVSAANVNTYLSGVKTYLTTLQTIVDTTFDGVALVVWSRKLETLFTITRVEMGNVLDTQRRRRDTLIETYTSLAYP